MRQVRWAARLMLLLVVTVVPSVIQADAIDDGVRRIALQLQCPVCEGQSAADSPSGLAADMRAVVRSRLLAGATDQQILDEFVASYGDSILAEPPKRGVSLGVWLGPLFGVVLGGALVVILLRTWRRTPRLVAPLASLPDSDVLDEFRRYRQEVDA